MLELEVWLGKQPVGRLTGQGSDASSFRFYDEYLRLQSRPILGLAFEENLSRVWRATQRLPPFFSNLLPESGSVLRRLIAEQLDVHEMRELLLLAELGADLPGNIIVQPLTEMLASDEQGASRPAENLDQAAHEQLLRFSLAGMQLKFSALRTDDKLTMPAHGIGGDWIVKLPDLSYPRVPENEYSMMLWAKRCDLNVPEFDLIDRQTIDNMPAQFMRGEENLCFIIERFDRVGQRESRVHIEDFAQVLSVHSEHKYDKHNFDSIGDLIANACGAEDLREYVRRLVFMVISGNADMHLKNWSLIYPDGLHPRLSPVYDYVSTVAYPELQRELALNFSKSKSFDAVSVEHFVRLADRVSAGGNVELSAETISAWVARDIERVMDTWASIQAELRLTADAKAAIEAHHERLYLLRQP